ncbi:MAG: hypothetical protein A2787_02120 [Omnitrophica WOR_2 bacterium RIFCSPHIGHO2_01_FULL_48_9]|nr:MAG: hypothetical protein A3D10_01840 [Omnitrophica WOR_2 bacterium RIFCSPHIGHO2_02_FULL_48_11]OGX34419.1 MAG: hypothetical protein A2787_02120 [Omnitrophica WOR_2 bacterium RIFCSPHIGHO2_01_FULL_48_9]
MQPAHTFRRLVILGNTGFIGGHLENYFRRTHPGLEIIGQSLEQVDLTQYEDAKRLAKNFDLETAVIMCSAIKRQFSDNAETFLQNVHMCVNLCRVLENAPVQRLVFFSSAAVYGEDIHNTEITEETLIQPRSYYGLAKYTSERLFTKIFEQKPQSSLLILRPPLIYGPGDQGKTYGPAGFLKAAINKELITLWGDGSELREFMFVEDVVKLIDQLMLKKHSGVVNVASGQSYTFRQVLDIVAKAVGTELKVSFKERSKNKVDNAFNNGNLSKIIGDFKFTSLTEGIRKTLLAETTLTEKTI